MGEGCEVDILRLGAQGEGVVEIDGRTLYVAGSLPGERVRIDDTGVGHVSAAAIVRRSADRIDPICRHFGSCGGCQLQHMAQEPYLFWKRRLVIDAFAARGLTVAPQPTVAIPPGTRRRAVLTTRHVGGRPAIGFHAAHSHQFVPIEKCPVMVPAIERELPRLAVLAAPLTSDRREARVTVTAGSNGLDVVFSGASGRKIEDAIASLGLISRWGSIIRAWLDERPIFVSAAPVMTMGPAAVKVPPGAFVQASAEAEAAMVSIVLGAIGRAKRVADLFCGIGTFTFHLARRARVLAIDSEAQSLAALETAARSTPGLKPIEARRRDLYADPLSPPELSAFDAIVFDPPRAGAAAQAAALARSKIKTIVAVSCNPATLARDVRTLVDGGYRLESLTPIDQFVYSAHVEAVAVLRR